MRDPERIHQVLAGIEAEWVKYPDMRLGQLLYFLLGNHMGDLFYVEDEQWLALQARRRELRELDTAIERLGILPVYHSKATRQAFDGGSTT